MTDFDNLSDEALRTKLLENGFPLMPITGTTRKIMIKKLKLLQENKKRANALERRTMAKYSSDDDSGAEMKPRARRATVTPLLPPNTSIKAQVNGSHATRTSGTKSKDMKETKDAKKSRLVVEVRHLAGDTGSDTEPEMIYVPRKRPPSFQRSAKSAVQVEEADADDDEHDSLGIIMSGANSRSQSFNSASSNTSASLDSPPRLFTASPKQYTPSLQRPQPIIPGGKSAYSVFQSPLALGEQATSTPGDDQDNPPARRTATRYLTEALPAEDFLEQTPYLRNFSKRLSLLTAQKDEERRGGHSLRLQRQERGRGIGPAAGAGNFFTRSKHKVMQFFRIESKRRIPANTNCRTTSGPLKMEENAGNLISVALIGAVAVFFVILLALYYGMHRGSNTNDIIGLKVPYCSPTLSKDCLTQKEAEGGIDLYKIFKPKLINLAIDYQCGYLAPAVAASTKCAKNSFYMTDDDIVCFVQENYKIQDKHAIVNDIDSLVLILHHNPFLGVSVLRVDPRSGNDEYLLVDDVKQANELVDSGLNTRAFAVLSPGLPWRCSFWQKVTALLKAAFIILSIASMLYASKFSYKWLKYYQHKRKEEVVMLVEKILEILQMQSGDDQFLVINHVRDMIIPVDSRKKMEGVWKRALKFIDERESRVRTEIQTVKGESYEVWRWIGAQNVSTLNCSGSSAAIPAVANHSAWQGEAFEVPTPPCSPTPCLKIRGMIDDGDRSCTKASIREAILNKCAECRVLHVAADFSTKCVYLKCADTNDAAIAYRSLHGNWFAGHLVTVKYLRLERYMQRFPDSPASGPPFLKP